MDELFSLRGRTALVTGGAHGIGFSMGLALARAGAALVFNSYVTASGLAINWDSLKILYISGVPYDMTHAAGSAFFLFVFGEKVIRKLERVKIKYGIYR